MEFGRDVAFAGRGSDKRSRKPFESPQAGAPAMTRSPWFGEAPSVRIEGKGDTYHLQNRANDTAIDAQCCPRNTRALLGGKKNHEVGNLIGPKKSAQNR
jgi:hypothetical protein